MEEGGEEEEMRGGAEGERLIERGGHGCRGDERGGERKGDENMRGEGGGHATGLRRKR